MPATKKQLCSAQRTPPTNTNRMSFCEGTKITFSQLQPRWRQRDLVEPGLHPTHHQHRRPTTTRAGVEHILWRGPMGSDRWPIEIGGSSMRPGTGRDAQERWEAWSRRAACPACASPPTASSSSQKNGQIYSFDAAGGSKTSTQDLSTKCSQLLGTGDCCAWLWRRTSQRCHGIRLVHVRTRRSVVRRRNGK